MKWPVFSEKELVIGNLDSSIGVCTLWSPRKEFTKKYLDSIMDRIAIVGNLYSVYGAGILIRNFLANPKMRYLVVSGAEIGNSKKAIKNLDKDNSLLLKMFLSESDVKRFLAVFDSFAQTGSEKFSHRWFKPSDKSKNYSRRLRGAFKRNTLFRSY